MRYLWSILFSCFVLAAYGQNSAAVKQLEQQRKEALAEIEMTNQLLQETTTTARNSLNRLNLLSRQVMSRRKVIQLLNQEMRTIDTQINALRREVTGLEKELDVKRENYGKSVQSLYKRQNSQDKLLFILSAETFSQSLRRMRYLREYADWQKRQASEIVVKQEALAVKQEELDKVRSEKEALLDQRKEENQKLIGEESTQKKEVQQLNKRQRELQAQLKKKQQQAAALNKQIERQIADEIARAEEAARTAREKTAATTGKKTDPKTEPAVEERKADSKGGYAMTKAEKQLSDNFASNRGKLPFPMNGRYTIVGTFGEQQHQELKYVRTNSSGIDIQTTPGTEARAVFNGEVTRVFVVPGYNNSVIVRHGNYLTVYSNISQVFVKVGDKVTTRQALGRIYSDTENGNETILHFQLWKEKAKLDPMPWLDR